MNDLENACVEQVQIPIFTGCCKNIVLIIGCITSRDSMVAAGLPSDVEDSTCKSEDHLQDVGFPPSQSRTSLPSDEDGKSEEQLQDVGFPSSQSLTSLPSNEDDKSEEQLQDVGFAPSQSLTSNVEGKSVEKINIQEKQTPNEACCCSAHTACSYRGSAKCGPDIPDCTPGYFNGTDLSFSPPPPYSALPEPVHRIETTFILHDVELSDRILGSGSYGFVAAATYNSLPVAAKCMHSVLQESTRCTAQFENEWETLQNIRHPHIVMFMGIYLQDNTTPYLIMELIEGGSLYQLVDSLQEGLKEITLQQKTQILLDVSLALEYLHCTHNIAHRDLSSTNVLLTRDLKAKVSDLGMSRPLTALYNQPSTLAPGCHLYMPPEALVIGSSFTQKGDIFSFAVIAIELFIEEHPRPRRARTSGLEMHRRMRDVWEFCRKAPEQIKRIVLQCLQDDPDNRPDAKLINPELKQFAESFEDCPGEYGARVSPLKAGVRQPQQASDPCQIASPLILPDDRSAHGSFLCADSPVCFPTSKSQQETGKAPEGTQQCVKAVWSKNDQDHDETERFNVEEIQHEGESVNPDRERHSEGTNQFVTEETQQRGEGESLNRYECPEVSLPTTEEFREDGSRSALVIGVFHHELSSTMNDVCSEEKEEEKQGNDNSTSGSVRSSSAISMDRQDRLKGECSNLKVVVGESSAAGSLETIENQFITCNEHSSLFIEFSKYHLYTRFGSFARDMYFVKSQCVREFTGSNTCFSPAFSTSDYFSFTLLCHSFTCSTCSKVADPLLSDCTTSVAFLEFTRYILTEESSFLLWSRSYIFKSSFETSVICEEVVSTLTPTRNSFPLSSNLTNNLSFCSVATVTLAKILHLVPQHILQHSTSPVCGKNIQYLLPKEYLPCKIFAGFSTCKSSTLNKPLRSPASALLKYFVYLHWCKPSLTYRKAPVTRRACKQLSWLMCHHKMPISPSKDSNTANERAVVKATPGTLVAYHNNMEPTHICPHLPMSVCHYQRAVWQTPAKPVNPRGSSATSLVAACFNEFQMCPKLTDELVLFLLRYLMQAHLTHLKAFVPLHTCKQLHWLTSHNKSSMSPLKPSDTLTEVTSAPGVLVTYHNCTDELVLFLLRYLMQAHLTHLKAFVPLHTCKQLHWLTSHNKSSMSPLKPSDTLTEVTSAPGVLVTYHNCTDELVLFLLRYLMQAHLTHLKAFVPLHTCKQLHWLTSHNKSSMSPLKPSDTLTEVTSAPGVLVTYHNCTDELVLFLLRYLMQAHLTHLKAFVPLHACKQPHWLTSHNKSFMSPLKPSDTLTEVTSAPGVVVTYDNYMTVLKRIRPHLPIYGTQIQQEVQQATAIQHILVHPRGNSAMVMETYSYSIHCRFSLTLQFMGSQCASIITLDIHLCWRHTMLTVKPGGEIHVETCFELKISMVFLAQKKYPCPITVNTRLYIITYIKLQEIVSTNSWVNQHLVTELCTVTTHPFGDLSQRNPVKTWKGRALYLPTITEPKNISLHFPTLEAATNACAMRHQARLCKKSRTAFSTRTPTSPLTVSEDISRFLISQWLQSTILQCVHSPTQGGDQITALHTTQLYVLCGQVHYSLNKTALHIPSQYTYLRGRRLVQWYALPETSLTSLTSGKSVKFFLQEPQGISSQAGGGSSYIECRDGFGFVGSRRTGSNQSPLGNPEGDDGNRAKKEELQSEQTVAPCRNVNDVSVRIWNVHKTEKLGNTCGQGEASISAPLSSTFVTQNPHSPWFLEPTNLQLPRSASDRNVQRTNLMERYFDAIIQLQSCQHHPDHHSNTFIFIQMLFSQTVLVRIWNVHKTEKTCGQGETSISAPLFSAFVTQNPRSPWFLEPTNLQLPVSVDSKRKHKDTDGVSLRDCKKFRTMHWISSLTAYFSSVASHTLASKSAAVIDEVAKWQQPPTWYNASNPVAGKFMSTHSVLSCNMHYFATFFQLIYFQYKATARKHKPEFLSLDLTKPVRVLSSPQSQSSSSNTGGGNKSGKGNSSGNKGGERSNGSGQSCGSGSAGNRGRRNDDDDSSRKWNQKPGLVPGDDKDEEQSEEEEGSNKLQAKRKNGQESEPQHLAAYCSSVASHTLASKSATVIDGVVGWQQPPTWYDAGNPVLRQFMRTHSVLSCNMHYFATFFQLIYFQYKATPRKRTPESLTLDLTKPVMVLSSPQSQSSSSNTGGGNNSSDSGKGNSKGGKRSNDSQGCGPGSAANGGRRNDDSDSSREGNQKPDLVPGDDKDDEQREERDSSNKWQAKRITGQESEPQHILDSKHVAVRKTPRSASDRNNSVQRTNLMERYFDAILQLQSCQHHPDHLSSTFIQMVFSQTVLVRIWNVRKTEKLGNTCGQGEASISAPLFSTFITQNPRSTWFLEPTNLQLPVSVDSKRKHKETDGVSLRDCKWFRTMPWVSSLAAYFSSVASHTKSAAVIDEVVEWQQPPTWYDAGNPVAGKFMSTHSVLSCNMHYFATFFQLIYFQYKATPRKHKPESLSLDLTKPVRVLSSPQSQSSSSNIGGGNNSSESGKGNSSGNKGGKRSNGSGQGCGSGSAGNGGRRNDDDDSSRKWNQKPDLVPVDDKDEEQSEEEKWQAKRKTGPESEPQHLLDSKHVAVRKTPPANSDRNDSVQRTKYDGINLLSPPLVSQESSDQPSNPLQGSDVNTSCNEIPKEKIAPQPSADLLAQNTEAGKEGTPDENAILEAASVAANGQSSQNDPPNAELKLDLSSNREKAPSHNAKHACKAPSKTSFPTHKHTLNDPMKCFCRTKSIDEDPLGSVEPTFPAPQRESGSNTSAENQKQGACSEVVVGNLLKIQYSTTSPSSSNQTDSRDGYSSGHSEARSDSSSEPEGTSEVAKDGNTSDEERSSYSVESHGWEEAEEITCSQYTGVCNVDHKDVLDTDGLEQAVECSDAEETNPTITNCHNPALPFSPTVFCFLPVSDVYETEVPLGPGITTFHSCATPSAVQAVTSNDFNVIPMEECPVVARLYQELCQNGIRPVHTSNCGGKGYRGSFISLESCMCQLCVWCVKIIFHSITGGFPLEMYIQRAIQNGDIALVAELLLHLVHCFQICTLWNTPFMLRKLMILTFIIYSYVYCCPILLCMLYIFYRL